MTQQFINNGSAAGDGQGENLYTAFGKVNANFTELYALPSGGSPAGSTNYIQYNVSGAFAASIKYQWDDATNTMTLGTGLTGTISYIKAADSTGVGNRGICTQALATVRAQLLVVIFSCTQARPAAQRNLACHMAAVCLFILALVAVILDME